MKSIYFLAIISIVAFTLFMFQSVDASPQCDDNQTPDLQMGDPACYTSISSGYWRNCIWGLSSKPSLCDSHNPWIPGVSYVTPVSSCAACSNPCRENVRYVNGCGESHCTNSGPVPPNYSFWVNTTSYICYYYTVSEWSVCDTETGVQSATSVTQHSTSGTNCQNLNEATTRVCGVCDATTNGQGTGSAPEPTEDLCFVGTPNPVPPTLNTETNMWEWECLGSDNAEANDDMECSAPYEEDGLCSSTYNNVVWSEVPPLSELCDSGTVVNFTAETPEGPWTWDCDPINPTTENGFTTKNCSARCFDITANISPNPFMWPTDGSEATVKVTIESEGMCSNRYTCEVDGNPYEFGNPVDHVINDSSDLDIPIECEGTEITPISTQGYCTSKTCNAQGSCQGTPVIVNSIDSSACTSTCNSNADCSRGRLIETKP